MNDDVVGSSSTRPVPATTSSSSSSYEMLDISELTGTLHDDVIVSATQLDVVLDRLVANLRRVGQIIDRVTALSERPVAAHTTSDDTHNMHEAIAVATHERLLLRKECHDGTKTIQAVVQDLATVRTQRQALTDNCERFLFMAINHYIAFRPATADLAQPPESPGGGGGVLPRIDLVNPALLDEYHDNDGDSGGDSRDTIQRHYAYAEGSTNPLHNVQISPY